MGGVGAGASVLVPFLHHAISGHNSILRQVIIMFCIGELILICYQKSLHDLFQYLSHWYNNVLLLLQACLIVGTTYDFMSSVFVAGRYLTKNLLSESDISQLFTSLIIEHPTRSVAFFCYQFFDFLSVEEIGIKFILVLCIRFSISATGD